MLSKVAESHVLYEAKRNADFCAVSVCSLVLRWVVFIPCTAIPFFESITDLYNSSFRFSYLYDSLWLWSFACRDAVKGLNGATLHGSRLRIEISETNKNKLGPRGGYKERKEISRSERWGVRLVPAFLEGSPKMSCLFWFSHREEANIYIFPGFLHRLVLKGYDMLLRCVC